ncbi:MAG: 50S ribosomal protein L5 [Vicinamibacteria bacterium]
MSRLAKQYQENIRPQLMKELELDNVWAVPRMKKVVVNVGVGEASSNIKLLDAAMIELGAITGQKPVLRRAKKSIAAFKLREGQPVGATVTLRGTRMYEFIDRLVNISLPRVRDFRGVPTRSFDGRGNYTMGLEDQLIFPEIDFSRVDQSRGMNVTFVTTARNDQGARRLLELLGLPFRRT